MVFGVLLCVVFRVGCGIVGVSWGGWFVFVVLWMWELVGVVVGG